MELAPIRPSVIRHKKIRPVVSIVDKFMEWGKYIIVEIYRIITYHCK